MAAPIQRIRIYGVQSRRSDERVKLPYVVRHSIDGRQRSRSFRTKGEAERYRTELFKAQHAGDRFDVHTGEPMSWHLPLADLGVHAWARRWLDSQWSEWQPRTRSSSVEALARFTVLAVKDKAVVPKGLRRYLHRALVPAAGDGVLDQAHERWLDRWCLALGDLDKAAVADIARLLTLKLDGEPLAATTANRYRTNSHACVLAAVEAGAIPADPWPKRSASRARRKVARSSRAVDVRSLPTPATMRKAIAAIETRQAGSLVYREMTSVAYYAGLRPSEVIMLRVRSLTLPSRGWGRIEVTEADIDWDQPGEPKTGPRSVPIPPVLVESLRAWLESNDLVAPDALLFRTRNGTRPNGANWNRAWKRALATVGHRPLRVYDCRHAAATTWLRAGVPLGETARRLGHSVETLVSTYVGALEDDEQISNKRIERALAK
jgi:integrase